MKFDIKLRGNSETCDHQIEFVPPGDYRAGAGRLRFVLNGETGEADWVEIGGGIYSMLILGRAYEVVVERRPTNQRAGVADYEAILGTQQYQLQVSDPRRRQRHALDEAHGGPREIRAPMPGKIVRVLVAENQEISCGQGLLVIEAMKMQNELRAPKSGRVEEIFISEGTGVETGARLIRLA